MYVGVKFGCHTKLTSMPSPFSSAPPDGFVSFLSTAIGWMELAGLIVWAHPDAPPGVAVSEMLPLKAPASLRPLGSTLRVQCDCGFSPGFGVSEVVTPDGAVTPPIEMAGVPDR